MRTAVGMLHVCAGLAAARGRRVAAPRAAATHSRRIPAQRYVLIRPTLFNCSFRVNPRRFRGIRWGKGRLVRVVCTGTGTEVRIRLLRYIQPRTAVCGTSSIRNVRYFRIAFYREVVGP